MYTNTNKNTEELEVDTRQRRAYKYPLANTSSTTLLKTITC